MKSIKKQHGMSLIGFFMMLTMVGIVAAAVVKVGPMYMEYFTVSSVFKEIQGDKSLAAKGKKEIRARIGRGFNINQVERANYHDTKITSTKNGYLVELTYEVRFPIVGNMEGIATFHPQANVNNP